MKPVTANKFVEELKKHRSEAEHKKIRRYFKEDNADNKVIGVRMKTTFDLAKVSVDMSLEEINKLLDSPFYEARMAQGQVRGFLAGCSTAFGRSDPQRYPGAGGSCNTDLSADEKAGYCGTSTCL